MGTHIRVAEFGRQALVGMRLGSYAGGSTAFTAVSLKEKLTASVADSSQSSSQHMKTAPCKGKNPTYNMKTE